MAEANTGKAQPAWTLNWDVDWVTAVAFVSNSRLAAGNNRGDILLWELPVERPIAAAVPTRRLAGHQNSVTRLLAADDGRSLISASYDHTIRDWDMTAAAAGKDSVILNAGAIARHEAAGTRARGNPPEPIRAEVSLQQAAQVLAGHQEWVNALALSRDGQQLLSGDDRGLVILWDRPAARERRRWQVRGWVQAAALAPDQRQAAISERLPLHGTLGRHAGLKLWNVDTAQVQLDLSDAFKDTQIAAAAYSPDGKLLALGEAERGASGNQLWLLDPATGKKVRGLAPSHAYGVTDLLFFPDGQRLASAGRDTMVRIWNVADGKLVKTLGSSRGTSNGWDWLHAISLSPDGRWLAAADMGGQVQVWSLLQQA